MNCVDFVKSVLTDTDFKKVEDIVNRQDYVRRKQEIKAGSIIVFTVGLHIGIAKVWGYELETIEYSGDKEVRRKLSLFDDNIKVVLVGIKGKKVGELTWLGA